MAQFTLLDGQTAAGIGPVANWVGGAGVCALFGNFDGATATLEFSYDGVNWISTAPEGAFSATTAIGFFLPICNLRAVVTGAGAATNITFEIRDT